MDSRQLEVFRTVAQERSFTVAARSLHLAQSAVSASVASLERDVGQRLFARSSRSVALTDAGAALLPWAIRVGADLRAGREALDEVGAGLSGTLRVGYMTGTVLAGIADALASFRRAHPQVTLHFVASPSGSSGLLDDVRRGTLDLAFLSRDDAGHGDVTYRKIDASPLVLVSTPDDPLAVGVPRQLAHLIDRNFVDLRTGFGPRTAIDALFAARGLTRHVAIETADLQDTATLVACGLGIAFLPATLVEGDPRFSVVELQDASVQIEIGVAFDRARELSLIGRRFLASVMQQVPGHPVPAPTDATTEGV